MCIAPLSRRCRCERKSEQQRATIGEQNQSDNISKTEVRDQSKRTEPDRELENAEQVTEKREDRQTKEQDLVADENERCDREAAGGVQGEAAELAQHAGTLARVHETTSC